MHGPLSTLMVVGMDGGHDLMVEKKFGTNPFEVGVKLSSFQTCVYGSPMQLLTSYSH